MASVRAATAQDAATCAAIVAGLDDFFTDDVPDKVRSDLREHGATDGFASLPFDEEWLVSMAMLAETARTLGDVERAAILYEPLLPYGNHVAICYPDVMTGAVSLYLGILAETMERWDDAVGHFEDAIDMNGRIGARPWLAHARHDLAATLLARGRPEDTARAQQLLSRALTGYRELGMQTYAARASALTLG